MIDEIPTIKEELERKTVEALVNLDAQIKAGAIDQRGAWVRASTLWSVTAGLVSNDVSQAAADLANQNSCDLWKRTFVHADATKKPLVLVIAPGKGYGLSKVDPVTGSRTRIKTQPMEPGDTGPVIEAAVNAILRSGYVEI